MYLEGDKWKNWHTRCSDAAIKENKDEEDTKLSTISVSKLLEYAHTALRNCEINHLDPDKVPVFLTLDHNENLYSYVGLSICSSSQLGTYVTLGSSDYYKMFYVAPDSKPEVGEYWRSRGVGYDLSGFVVSKLAGERLTRLVKYVLNTDEPLSHLDYREFEPNWIQFKFQEEEFNLELLDKLARANKNIVNEAIWLTSKFGVDGEYKDILGLCKIATIAEVEEKNYSLTPGAYVGVAEVEDDGVDFHERMNEIHAELKKLNEEANVLMQDILKGWEEMA